MKQVRTKGHRSGSEKRVVGALGAMAVVVGSMLGIGIFLTPPIVADHVSYFPFYLAVWLFGGFVSFCGAVAYAELGSMFPRSGGDYVFLDAAFGRSAAVAGGWLLFLGVFCGSVATMAVAVCEYQLPVLLAHFTDVSWTGAVLEQGFISVTGVHIAGIALIMVLTMWNVLGTGLTERLQIMLTAVPIVALTLVAVWVFVTVPHDTAVAAVEPVGPVPPLTLSGFAGAFLAVYFAYAGWNAVAYLAGEVKDYERNLPLGLVGGTVLMTVLYVLMACAFALVLGMGGLPESTEVGTETASALWGERGELAGVLIIAIALVGSVNATIFAGSRIAAAMGRDAVLPRVVGRWGGRSTPAVALWLQATVSILLILSGTFVVLLELTSVAMLALGSLVVSALFVLRKRNPQANRPYRATGYPFLPAFYIIVSIGIVIISLGRALGSIGNGKDSFEMWFPLVGLVLFGLVYLIHHIVLDRSEDD